MPVRNVLWIMSDQHAWFASGCYGHPFVHTPNLDRLAAEGLAFDAAYTPSPVCVPARFAALCGRYPHRTGTPNGQPLPPRVRTAAHHFSRLGHLTAFVGKLHPVDPQPHGFDFYVDMGHYYDYLGPRTEVFARGMDARNSGCGMPWLDIWYKQHSWRGEPLRAGLPAVLPKEDHFEFFVARCCEQFLNRHGAEPFFLCASLLKPHFPFVCPPEYHARYRPEAMVLPPNFDASADVPHAARGPYYPDPGDDAAMREARAYIADYYAATTFMDEAVGEILAALERAGRASDTLVVYTSDHGEMLYQHALRGKFVFYEGSARVPLLVRTPDRRNAGRRTAALTDLTDLLPTSLAQCGGNPAALDLDGVDLSPVLLDPAARPRDACFSELAGRVMIREAQWKLARYPADGAHPETWHFFDLAADSEERKNLYPERQDSDLVRRLRERLLAWHAE